VNAIFDWLKQNGIAAPAAGHASDFVSDSRLVRPGAVFAALPGSRTDGVKFVSDAVARGAVLVLSERAVEAAVPVAVVPDLRARLPRLAATFYAEPSRRMQVVGITGTNGKTTTTFMVEEMLRHAGRKTGLIGTIAYRYGDVTTPAPNTTPDPVSLQRLLAAMHTAGTQSVAMEVSSHGLHERRVDGTEFDVAVFTNLTRDHLDYHADMESYFAAKRRLFSEVLPAASKAVRAVINVDDPYGARLAAETVAPVWTVGTTKADFQIGDVTYSPAGFSASVATPFGTRNLACKLPGKHNVYNAVEALAAVLALGVEPAAAVDALARVAGVPGRLEYITDGSVHVYVDYAHTDDALANVLAALRPLAGGRIVTVFGCGGDRDRGKRPAMGRVAAQGSDVAVVTSDNPRTEDPKQILADIEPGVSAHMQPYDGVRGCHVEIDRRAAIQWAIAEARPGDIVLVAGKGHEDYQILGTEKFPFSDREEVRRALDARKGVAQ
jgi:UDP-N-acetylmuramoyl-L-alanyl-D-glutamate--2,6-diaminopimelate ligase